jgi:hypothetical protein
MYIRRMNLADLPPKLLFPILLKVRIETLVKLYLYSNKVQLICNDNYFMLQRFKRDYLNTNDIYGILINQLAQNNNLFTV